MTLKIAEHAIYELLKTKSSGRVYFMRAPQNVSAPFVIIQRVAGSRDFRSINNAPNIVQATIQIDVYAESYFEMKIISSDIESTLDAYRGLVYYGDDSPQDFVRIAGVSMQSENDLIDQTEEPFLYRHTADYLVTYEQ